MEMRMLGGHLCTAGAETPYPVICRDPVGQPDLYQPFQIAVETDAIHPPRFRGFQALLELGVTEGLLSFQKRLEHHHPQACDTLSGGAETLRRVSIGNCCSGGGE